MDEGKSELHPDEAGTLEKNPENFLRDIQFTDAKGSTINLEDGTARIEEDCSVNAKEQATFESVLLNDEEEEDDGVLHEISINSPCELETSTVEVPPVEKMTIVETDLPCEMSSETSTNIVLSMSPMLVPSDSNESSVCKQIENVFGGDKSVQSDTEMFSSDSNVPCTVVKSDLEKDIVEERSGSTDAKGILTDLGINGLTNSVRVTNYISEHSRSAEMENGDDHGSLLCSTQPTESINETSSEYIIKGEPLTDVIKNAAKEYLDGNSLRTSTISMKQEKTPTTRPTLADDSKLVKISLPTNPMNMMPSNAQFLNKSRYFLNFITEKSTNIMEKALLPQQLAAKYNSNLRITDAGAAKKCTDDFSTASVPFSLTDSPSITDTESLRKSAVTSDISVNSLACERNEVHTSQIEDAVDNRKKPLPSSYTEKDSMHAVKQNDRCISSDNSDVTVSNTEDNNLPEETCPSSINRKVVEDSVSNAIMNSDVQAGCTTLNSEINECQSLVEEGSQSPKEDPTGVADTNLRNSSVSLLQHPAYLTLLKDCANFKMRNLQLSEKVQNLEEVNKILESEKSGEVFVMQIETLEKTVDRLTNELRLALTTQDVLKREHAVANKERESMVMKYAVGEKQLIDTQRARDLAERKLRDTMKDNELLQNKLRQLQGERTRICNILDSKCREVADLQREVERLKEEVNRRDVKLKWSQNKLKTEMELQKETQQKLDKALTRINDMREECDQMRRETQESIRKFQVSEENKAVTLDQQLKEQQAQLILERHVTEDKEMLRLQLQKEVDVLQNRQQALIEENNTLSLKIQDAEKNRLNYESSMSNLKILADQRQKEVVDLLAKTSQLETVKLQLQHTEQCLSSIETEIDHLRAQNAELQQDMSACRQREADMLDFTQKLTEKNVRLQLEFTAMEARTKQLNEEQGPLRERISELTMKIKTLEENLAEEKKKRTEECEILAKHVAEQTQLAQNLAQKLEESEGENAVLKRKQIISVKEMTRELQQCRRRLEAYERASPSNSLEIHSRTASNTSLNTGDTINGALSDNSANAEQTLQSAEPSRQTLINRIIHLQHMNCKRAEKLDYFKEHTRMLVEELQKKKKVIQNYILHENSGAMSSNEMDRHKAELAKHGGIMASIYSQRISDKDMTLELSLQINEKQRAVLEDVLLKNIMLKNNIDTLSQEIASLTMQIQQRKVAS